MKNFFTKKDIIKYLFETFVIIFSVTASFYIQDLVNYKNTIEFKNKGLEGVLLELTSDSLLYESDLVDFNRKRMEYIDSLFDNEKTYKLDYLSYIWGDYIHFENKRYFDGLISTGSIDYISNVELQTKLTNYYNIVYGFNEQGVKNDSEYLKLFINRIVNFKMDSVKYEWPTATKYFFNSTEIEKIRNDEKLKSICFAWKMQISELVKRLNLAQERIPELKRLIHSELKN
tara:strand:- start:47 stop:736 length:690 start_codon:yes stop_codon:yes gene_type:complete